MFRAIGVLTIIFVLDGCEQDPPVEHLENPQIKRIEGSRFTFKKLALDCSCCHLLNGFKGGLVLDSRRQYNRLIDSVNFEETPFPCERADFNKGFDFKNYTYLIKLATVGGCSAEFNTRMFKKGSTLKMLVEAHGYGLCQALRGSVEVARIPKALRYDTVVFTTKAFNH